MSQTERRSDSELIARMRSDQEAWRYKDRAADRLSEYAALGATLPSVPCPNCGGTGTAADNVPICPNPVCDHGTVRLTLADAVALTVRVHTAAPVQAEWLYVLRAVRA